MRSELRDRAALHRFLARWLAVLLIAGACASPRAPTPATRVDVQQLLREDPAYREVQDDTTLEDQFERYFTWLRSLETPDVAYLASLPADDLEHLAMLFHEKVELRGWLRLGHRFEDVVNVDYYQQHYVEVYTAAHADAMVAELGLVSRFAERIGIRGVPSRAFVLVGPMVERRGVTPAMVDRRLKFNRDIAALQPTRADLDRATRVYEVGGYRYRNRQLVVDEAWAAVTLRQ